MANPNRNPNRANLVTPQGETVASVPAVATVEPASVEQTVDVPAEPVNNYRSRFPRLADEPFALGDMETYDKDRSGRPASEINQRVGVVNLYVSDLISVPATIYRRYPPGRPDESTITLSLPSKGLELACKRNDPELASWLDETAAQWAEWFNANREKMSANTSGKPVAAKRGIAMRF